MSIATSGNDCLLVQGSTNISALSGSSTLWKSNAQFTGTTYGGSLCTSINCNATCVTGDYIQIIMPLSFRFWSVSITSGAYGSQRPPNAFLVFGSNSFYDWTQLASFSMTGTWPSNQLSTVAFNSSSSSNFYKFYRLSFQSAWQTQAGSNSIGIHGLSFNGYFARRSFK